MKIFNRMTRQQFVDGHLIPTNAFYGRLVLKYTDRVFTGKVRLIFDKDGYPLFNADGTQKTRKVYKRVNKAVEVTYSLEDLFPVSVGNHTYFKAWYKIGRDGHWRDESVLNHNGLEVTLNNFIVTKVQEFCTQNKCGLFDICTAVERPHLNRTHECAQQAAHRREVQKSYIYTGGERSLMGAKFVLTDGVRMDAPMGKSVIANHKNAFNGKGGEEPGKPYTSPAGKCKAEMRGKDPVFRKFISTPTGIMRFYNEQEYNDYVSAQNK